MRYFTAMLVLVASSTALAQTETVFRGTLSHEGVLRAGVAADPSSATGRILLTLSVPDPGATGSPTAAYRIVLNDLDLDGNQSGPSGDNVTAIHLHDITPGIDATGGDPSGVDTGGTQHVFNIFGVPGNDDPVNNPFGGDDDNDVQVFPAAGRLRGIWEDSDAVERAGMPLASTLPLSAAEINGNPPSVVDRLHAGNIWLMVHTSGGSLPGGETIGGYLTIVPEPGAAALLALAAGGLATRRQRTFC